jgi:hypothetical protein
MAVAAGVPRMFKGISSHHDATHPTPCPAMPWCLLP